VYFAVAPTWPGLVWIAGLAIYVCAIPVILGIQRRSAPAVVT
jgi:DHA1 family tetracycline resistance protein-like MFS transporter